METKVDYNKEAIKLVQEIKNQPFKCKGNFGQSLFEETAICMAIFHAERLASVTAAKHYYELLLALKQLQIDNKNQQK